MDIPMSIDGSDWMKCPIKYYATFADTFTILNPPEVD
jgi:hypothetical protein